MRNDKRQEALEKIRSSEDVRLILISFKAGSTGENPSAIRSLVCGVLMDPGLNLTCCNNVILTDLWWNPA